MGRLTHTVSGSIATVRSPAVAPIESLKVHFSPIQEGTGDPSPSNIRPITGWTGVKLYSGQSDFNYKIFSGTNTNLGVTWVTDSNGKTTATGIPTSWSIKDIYDFDVHGDETIYGRIQGTLNNVTFAAPSLYDSNGQALTGLGLSDAALSVGIDLSQYNDVKKVRIRLKHAYNDIEMNGKSCFIVTSKTNQTNAPIQITFPVVGKNLYDAATYPLTEGKWVHGGNENVGEAESYAATLEYVPCRNFAGRTITLNKHLSNGAANPGIAFYNQNKQYLSGVKNNNASGTSTTYNVPSDAYYLRFTVPAGSTNVQLELGSTATTYEPYSSDNTVYGGYVDLATGNIIATYKSIIFDGSEDEAWNNEYGDNYYIKLEDSKVNDTNYCNVAKYLPATSQLAVGGCKITGTLNFNIQIGNVIGINYDVPGFRNWLNQNNIQLVYALGNSKIVATLTPQELATFKGYSNFWSNAGDVDVTYQVVESSEMTKERQKIFAGNAPTIHTASGSVANFEMEPGLNRNLKSCKVGFLPVQEGSGDPFPPINQNGSIVGVNNTHNESELSSFKIHFSPIQSGSGDPSPTNIRPITGWTGVTGYKGGKNLYSAGDQSFERFKKVSLGRTFSPGTYTLSLEATSTDTDDSKCDVYLFYGETSSGKSKGFSRDTRDSWTFTIDVVFDSLWMYAAQTWLASEGDTATFSNIQLEIGSIATTYEAYSAPTSYPVSWESQGTVYGGYVDLVSGDVVAEYEILSDTWGNFTKVSGETGDGVTEGRYKRFAHAVYGNGITNHYTDCCNVAKYNYANINGNIHYYIVGASYNCRVYLPIGTDENLQIQAIGKLVTPIKITTLTSTQIALTTGKSSYWSNADAVTVETVGNVRPIKGWEKLNICSSKQNIFDPNELTTININGSDRNAVAYTSPGTYKLKAYGSSTEAYLSGIVKNSDGTWSSVYYVVGNTYAQNMSITIVSGQTLYVYDMQNSPKETSVSRFVSWQFQVSLGNSFLDSYESYSGSKYSIEFPVQGKNLLDVSNMTHGSYNIGSIPNILEPNTTYTFSVNGDTSKTYRLFATTEDFNTGVNYAISLNASYINKTSNLSFRTFTTPANIKDYSYLALAGNDSSAGNVPINDIKPQVELGSSATSYEPYDNSIFGGYVDLVSGEVLKSFRKIKLTDIPWNNYSGKYIYYGQLASDPGSLVRKPQSIIYSESISLYKTGQHGTLNPSEFTYKGPGTTPNASGSDKNYIWVRLPYAMETNDMRSWLASNYSDVYLYYELATPQLVTTLTPTQIQALKGTNNILSDANGIIEVKYWSH